MLYVNREVKIKIRICLRGITVRADVDFLRFITFR